MSQRDPNFLALLQKGDPVKGRGLGKCAKGKFHRIYEDRVGNTIVEYFCDRSQHAHGVIPGMIISITPIRKLKARQNNGTKKAHTRKQCSEETAA